MLKKSEALEKLSRGDLKFPPLILRVVSTEALWRRVTLDWIAELEWEEETVTFAVEYIRISTPKSLRAAINLLASTKDQIGPFPEAEQLRPMVMAPFLDEDELLQLTDERISGIDFCGNGVVIIPGKWLVYRTGQPNQYPSSLPIKQIYRGKSSLVGHVLLLKRQFSQVSELKKEIEDRGASISLGTVSKVLKSLDQELIVSRQEGVALLQAGLLLDQLKKSYEPPEDLQRIRGRLPEDSAQLQNITRAGERLRIKVAVSGAQHYAQLPTSDRFPPIYVESLERLSESIGFQPTSRFSDVELRQTRDPIIYFDRRKDEGICWTSPVQTYLELATGGKREREIGEELRPKILGGEID
ncbi:MAG: hypothetical protein ACE5HV_09350 [Acidobacteriota bacterium]